MFDGIVAGRFPRWRRRLSKWYRAICEVFLLAPKKNRVLVIVGTLVANVLDLIGLTMMVPLIIAATHLTDSTKGIVVAFNSAFSRVGLPFEPLYIVILIVIGLGLKALVSIGVTRYVGDVVSQVTRDMRIRLIRSLLGARWSYFLRQPVGRLAFAIGPEADAAGQCFESLAHLIASMLQVMLFVTVAAIFFWQLLFLALIISVITALWFGVLVRHGRQMAKEHRRVLRARSAKFTDALIGIKPIRAMGRVDRFAAVFEHQARDLASNSRRPVLSGEFAADLQEPIVGAMLAIGLFVAGTRLNLEVHDLLIMSIVIVKIVGALLPIQREAQRFIQSSDEYRSLCELLRVSDEAKESTGGQLKPAFREAINFEAVSFSYGERPIFKHLTMYIQGRSITTLVGPSGVGKSTIVDLLVMLYSPGCGGHSNRRC